MISKVVRAVLVVVVVVIMAIVIMPSASFAEDVQARAITVPPEPNPGGDTAERPKLLPRLETGFAGTPAAASFQEVCPSVRLENRGEFTFNVMEERLLCGDNAGGEIGKPWEKIPPNEASYFLRGFLQARGFHEPEFIQDGEALFVRPGNISRLKNFRILGGPATWNPPRRRLVIGEPLTPPLLDGLQSWTLSQIKNEGYACAKAVSRADPAIGEAVVALDTGEIKKILGIEDKGDTGLRAGVLDRYNAFHVGDIYREWLVSLTRTRTQEDGFLQSLMLSARCEPNGVVIIRDVNLGPSRTVSIGAGASTDEGGRVRVVVRQNRIGDSASRAEAKLNLSYRDETTNKQIVDSNFRWYYAPGEARSYVQPRVIFEHIAENNYDSQSVTGQVLHGWNKELRRGQFELLLGPNYQSIYLPRSTGPDRLDLWFGEASAQWTSHEFEFFGTSPRAGELLYASALYAQKDFGANFTGQKLQFQGRKLWNIFRYDPPLLILGARFAIQSVFSHEDLQAQNLPLRFQTRLGGEQDIRGFDRETLPRGRIGALSGASGGFEARFHKVIFRRVDAFTFVDSGLLGGKNFDLRRPVFMSPGAGLRWESPVGTLRGYVAQRFAVNEEPAEVPYGREWRFGFTFGEEF